MPSSHERRTPPCTFSVIESRRESCPGRNRERPVLRHGSTCCRTLVGTAVIMGWRRRLADNSSSPPPSPALGPLHNPTHRHDSDSSAPSAPCAMGVFGRSLEPLPLTADTKSPDRPFCAFCF